MAPSDYNNLKTITFPFHEENPYQSNLLSVLERLNIEVHTVRGGNLFNLKITKQKNIIFHLHWAHGYLLNKSLILSLYKSLIFFKFLTLRKLSGNKLIWTIHNLSEHEPRHPKFEMFCYRWLAFLADGIIVHSKYAKDEISKHYKISRPEEKIRIIQHGNYIGNYPNETSQEQARSKLGIGQDKKVFLFFGQIRTYKGIPELISAFKGMSTGNEVLLIAGKPLNEKIKSELENLIIAREDIKFIPGFVDDNDIQLYMNSADAVVFPFQDIFTSGSALLAMSFSKAMILPDLESLKEIMAIGGTISYQVEDEEGLRTSLLQAISSDLKVLGARNLEAAKEFSWESIGRQTADLYNKALSTKRRKISAPA